MKVANGTGPEERMRARRRSAGVGIVSKLIRMLPPRSSAPGQRGADARAARPASFLASERADPALVLAAVAGVDLERGVVLARAADDVQAHVAEHTDLTGFGDGPFLVRSAGAGRGPHGRPPDLAGGELRPGLDLGVVRFQTEVAPAADLAVDPVDPALVVTGMAAEDLRGVVVGVHVEAAAGEIDDGRPRLD